MSLETIFDLPVQVSAQAPGRVNLMGEHTDYNNGFVLPTILPHQTMIQIATDDRAPGEVEIFSEQFQQRITCKVEQPIPDDWSAYILACLQQLQKHQISIPGLKIWIKSTVPIGAGVASSAALEVAFLKAMRDLLGLDLTDIAIALMTQKAESEGVGMPCGVMDQMVSALGQPHHAFFLDTQDLSFEQIPLPTDYQFAVVHSGTTHALVEGNYQQRRQDCEAAAAILKVSSLRQVSEKDIDRKNTLPDTLRQRVLHVVTENQRVLDGVTALKDNRIADFGQLMNASHLSQKNDFAVTIPETDALCQRAINCGAFGARQTGGGFGGAIVALVPTTTVQDWWTSLFQVCPKASFICTC